MHAQILTLLIFQSYSVQTVHMCCTSSVVTFTDLIAAFQVAIIWPRHLGWEVTKIVSGGVRAPSARL